MNLHPVIRPVTTIITLALLAITPLLSLNTAHAATVGLQISPVRQFLSVDAGKSVSGTISVTNNTTQPLNVTLSVQQFSVTDYLYNYEFRSPANDWLHLGQTTAELSPKANRAISYIISPPADATPGGRYYTVIASARASTGSTIQVAQPVYLTVNGQLLRTSMLNGHSLPRVVFGRDIPYSLEPVNTGNVYFFAYLSGKWDGMFTHESAQGGTHILMPDKPRQLTGTIPSPVLPGIYKVSFGYRTDANESVSKSQWIVYMPPWFMALLIGILLIAGRLLPRRHKPNQASPIDS